MMGYVDAQHNQTTTACLRLGQSLTNQTHDLNRQVNSQGMIYEHIIENVIRNDLVEKPSIVSDAVVD